MLVLDVRDLSPLLHLVSEQQSTPQASFFKFYSYGCCVVALVYISSACVKYEYMKLGRFYFVTLQQNRNARRQNQFSIWCSTTRELVLNTHPTQT